MGTAYLFTEEAVATGAITPGFQDGGARCERTVLLETAPGHATRCVETDYVRDVRARTARARGRGAARGRGLGGAREAQPRAACASPPRGSQREGDRLVDVDDADAAARGHVHDRAGRRRSLVPSHHRSSCTTRSRVAATACSRRSRPTRSPQPRSPRGRHRHRRDGCDLPGRPISTTIWANIVGGVQRHHRGAARALEPGRLLRSRRSHRRGEKTPSKWGGFLSDVRSIRWRFGIPPKSLAAIEPVQLLSLEVARRALADAGYVDRASSIASAPRSIFGAEAGTDLRGATASARSTRSSSAAMPATLDEPPADPSPRTRSPACSRT